MQDCRLVGYRFESVGLDEIYIHPNARVVHSAGFVSAFHNEPFTTVEMCHARVPHTAANARRGRHNPPRRK